MKTEYDHKTRILTAFDGDGEPMAAYEFLSRVTETGAGIMYRAWSIQRMTRRTFEDFTNWVWGHFGVTCVARSLRVLAQERDPESLT